MSYQARVEAKFDAGHRLHGYSGLCRHPHGHSYTVEVVVAAQNLDSVGMSMDFTDLKTELRGWLKENWDHAFLINSADRELMSAFGSVADARLFIFEDQNPTVEVMAQVLYDRLANGPIPSVQRVIVWESQSQYAEYSPKSI